ncbi:GntR family transcriptional regulator [Arsenicicoccus sp. oral taxon 190]|uniref:GntR family transcriptional regulator n=1 Tax=Arsenicicoccus sp. oral taxon 190 TaxID=1658671 RepID=UPI00067A248B|nr:GntR family transcriptional regulator [Arsenicicoccus sp. oral taxon 190]AKT51813.1 GntR family transcriptional regulator [Arsenicicoccus sp. oral taxon 190]
MLITIDPESTEPLYGQLVAQVRGAILRGDVGPGDKLPGARDLAASLGINMHTVLRAYTTLRDEGAIELRRGRGAVVTAKGLDSHEIEQAARRLLEVARRHGLTLPQIHAALDQEASS